MSNKSNASIQFCFLGLMGHKKRLGLRIINSRLDQFFFFLIQRNFNITLANNLGESFLAHQILNLGHKMFFFGKSRFEH
jgi:hypothetical protein